MFHKLVMETPSRSLFVIVYRETFLCCALTFLGIICCWKFATIIKCTHFFCRFFNNAYYARVGGVSTAELNRMEVKFLFSLDFRLQVNVNTFRRICCQLEKEAAQVLQIERPIQPCKIKENWSNKGDSACVTTIARWKCIKELTHKTVTTQVWLL